MGHSYAVLFLAALLGWPLALGRGPGTAALGLAANAAALALVWHRSASGETGFFGGLAAVGERMRMGFVPLSLLVLAVVFPVVLALAALHTLLGLPLGRAYTQRRWTGLVTFFENLM